MQNEFTKETMENKLKRVAIKYSEAGFSVLPVSQQKIPKIFQWGLYQTRPMTIKEIDKHFDDSTTYMALICGTKKRVFCVDIDVKYDVRGDLVDRLKEVIPKPILKKAFVQQTQSGGLHFVFIVPQECLKGNEKWASRYTTPEEKHQTYLTNFNRPDTRDKALKIALSDKSRVLVETRGVGGYFLITPSPGYTHLSGKFTEITSEEFEALELACRSLNEVIAPPATTKYNEGKWEKSPFVHYNESLDVLDVLDQHGWEIISERGEEVRLKRPGQTSTRDSAIFHKDSGVFNCFSTSTVFDPSKSYMPTNVLAELEADGDLSIAFELIVNKGYGIKQ